ncbi:MAG: serine/threonine protein kinase [Planctomycetaceae bacterium]|nr:serine/threonine protein kinase [Planctomycetaceae bacterium]
MASASDKGGQDPPAASTPSNGGGPAVQKLGKYELRKKIGAGGMGAVYLALDTQLKRSVALKMLPREKAKNATLVKRFKAEAHAAAQLKHDNIVTIYEAGEADGYLYIALEYVEGTDVFKLLGSRGVLTVKRSIDIVKQVASALDHLHARNIVHRDIKPSNLLIQRSGTVKLTDMGLARSVDDEAETGITRDGMTVGTVDYMSPEQARDSKQADIRSDIYSLGCTWYHMLTGTPPFATGSLTNKLYNHASKSRPDPRDENEAIPEGVVETMHRMMARKPADRYQTPAELLADLENVNSLTATSADKLLEAISEVGDSKTNHDTSARPRADTDSETTSRSKSRSKSKNKGRDTSKNKTKDASIDRRRDTTGESPDTPEGKARETRAESSRTTAENSSRTGPRDDSEPEVWETSEETPRGTPEKSSRSSAKSKPEKSSRSSARKSQRATPTSAAAGVRTGVAANATVADSPDGSNEWVKYAVGLGAIAGLLIFVVLLIQEFSNVLDSGGVNVDRGGNASFDDESDGTELRGEGPTAPGSADGSTSGGGNDGRPNGNVPTRGSTPIPKDVRAVVHIRPTADSTVLKTIEIGRDGEKEYMPPWIVEFPTPESPQVSGHAAGMQTLSVGRADETVSKYPNINAALKQLPAAGGVIQLVGAGPFELNPLEISGGQKVIITGKLNGPPVVVLQPDTDDPAKPVVTVADGSLTLLNLQLAASAERFGGKGFVTIFDVVASDLAIRQCSFTLLGQRRGRTTVVRSSLPAEKESVSKQVRLLLDRMLIRGDDLTAISAGGAACDLVASNCLFISGTAPIIRVSGSMSAAAAASVKRKRAGREESFERVLRFVSCTGVASRAAFEFARGNGGGLPPTGVLTLNSLFATQQRDGETVLASLGNWPLQKNRRTDESSFINLTWTVRSSICTGWTGFLKHDGDPPFLVSSIPQWQNRWNRLVESSRFAKNLQWPVQPLTSPAEAEPALFDSTTTEVKGVVATDGGAPGCQTADLISPSPEILRRVAALAEQPILPPPIFQSSDPVRSIQVDLNKEDLGKVISQSDWRSGTLFVASGAGTRKSSPIQVRGISIRIEFRQTGGLPLQIEPKPVSARTAAREGLLSDALVSVDEGGRIEIAHGRFRIPNSRSVSYPKWLLVAREGSFSFEDCIVLGPLADNSRTEGLIRWERPAKAAVKSLDAGRYEQYGEIRDSYFKSFGKLLQLDIAGRAMFVSNSVLVSSEDMFDLNIRGDGPLIHGAAHIANSTLSAARTFFKVSADPINQPAAKPLQLVVENTVFAPPVSGTPKSGPALLAYNAAFARTERQMQWWGQANGYTHLLRKHLDGPAETSGGAEQFETGWGKAWGLAACLRPLHGSGAIALEKPLPPSKGLEPADFALHPSSKAVRWTIEGKPIGANVQSLAGVGPKSSTGATKPAGGKGSTPRKAQF